MTDIDELRRLLERLDEVDPVPWVVLENGKIGTPDTPANTDTNREDEVNECGSNSPSRCAIAPVSYSTLPTRSPTCALGWQSWRIRR